MKKIPEELTEQQQKAINKFLSWWVQMWYIIFLMLLCSSFWFFSYVISKLMAKANGEPFEEMGIFFGGLCSTFFIIMVKKWVYDVLTIKKLDKLIK